MNYLFLFFGLVFILISISLTFVNDSNKASESISRIEYNLLYDRVRQLEEANKNITARLDFEKTLKDFGINPTPAEPVKKEE